MSKKSAVTKTASCPIHDALNEFEKSKQALDKFLQKEANRCKKNYDALVKKKKSLSLAKKKASERKKTLSEKVKLKATAANKNQLLKAKEALQLKNAAIKALQQDIDAAKHGHFGMQSLIKQRLSEEKLLIKFRKEQQAIAKKKAKKKAK